MVKLIPCEMFIICIQIRSHIRNSNYCPFFLAFIVRKKREKEREEERGRKRERDRERDRFIYTETKLCSLVICKMERNQTKFLRKCIMVHKLVDGNLIIKGEVVSGRNLMITLL